jgi:hypothetical protein
LRAPSNGQSHHETPRPSMRWGCPLERGDASEGSRRNNFRFWRPGLRRIWSRRLSESAGVGGPTLRNSRLRRSRRRREPGMRKPEVIYARALSSSCCGKRVFAPLVGTWCPAQPTDTASVYGRGVLRGMREASWLDFAAARAYVPSVCLATAHEFRN